MESDKIQQAIANNQFMDILKNMSVDELKELKSDGIKNSEFWNREIKNEEQYIKNVKKAKNKSLDSLERFKGWIFAEYASKKLNNSGFFIDNENEISKDIDKNILNKNILKNMLEMKVMTQLSFLTGFFNYNGKYFMLNNNLLSLLRSTDTKIEYQNVPYKHIFLETSGLIINNIELLGISILNRCYTEDNDSGVLEIIAYGIDLNDNNHIWQYAYINENESLQKSDVIAKTVFHEIKDQEWISKNDTISLIEQIKLIVINFLNFTNHQDVELIINSNKLLRESRVAKGRLGVPDTISINLTGKLKRYINESMEQNEKAWELGHRFWVRGHWMEFKHDRYKNKQGQKTWVLPYIKGSGELIKKDYYIGEKEQCWAHEAEMIKIIKELYPEYEVKKHDRTTLNGLEIDCYIPELKLGFEYNGKQHYEHVEIFHKTIEDFEKQKERDIEKMKRAKEKGIKIVVIRFDEAVTKEVIEAKL